MARSIEIVESHAETIALTFQEAQLLVALGRRLASQKSWWAGEKSTDASIIRCEPAGTSMWRVTVFDAVGSVALGDLQLIVKPKISSAHVLYLLEHSELVPRLAESRTWLFSGNSLADLFAWWYVTAAERLLRLGTSRGYREVGDQLDCVIGCMDAVATVRCATQGRPLAVCEFEEFDEDTPHNRVIRAAAALIARHAVFPRALRNRAQIVANELDTVGPVRPLDMHAYIDRATMHYAEALFFAKSLLSGAGLAIEAGGKVAHSFLIRTPELIEAGLRLIIQKDLGSQYHVEKRGKRADTGEATFTPDIVIDGQAVADVKYRHFRVDWSRTDLNQALAFATVFGARKAAVIGFVSSPHDRLPQGISVSGHSVRPIAWLASAEVSPSEARQRFTAQVREWLDHDGN